MKETLLSNCEKSFVLKAIAEGRRLDGRRLTDYRDLEILFGTDYGSCQVSMGETRVLAQVSCEIQQPKATRPNEGLLHINVGLSPMGAPHFEVGRQSDTSIQLNRLLEKCIKDSRCVDLESLCIVAEEKVWVIRVDVNVLNHAGNLADCASVAALAALTHFRRPDVELHGEELVVFEPEHRDPIPLSLRHHPVCISFAVFCAGRHIAVDPSSVEERVAEAQLTLGVNGYRELCGVYLSGATQSGPEVVRQCGAKAATRAVELVTQIKQAIAEDSQTRLAGGARGFTESVRHGQLTALAVPEIRLPERPLAKAAAPEEQMEVEAENAAGGDLEVVQVSGPGCAELGLPEDLHNSEENSSSSPESDSESEASSVELVQEVTAQEKRAAKIQELVLSGDSEEEETVMLVSEHRPQPHKKTPVSPGQKKKRGKHKKKNGGFVP